jgi:hypothetical protein
VKPRKPERVVDVDDELETRIVAVESAVVAYLVRITPDTRDAVAVALAALDDESAASDTFRSRLNALATSAALSSLGSSALDVIGQTNRFPIVREVPASVFRAQVALVRAARAEVQSGDPSTFDALTRANDELAGVRRGLFGDDGHADTEA